MDTTIRNFKKIVEASTTQFGAEICEVKSVDLTNLTVTVVGQITGRTYEDVPFVPVPGKETETESIPGEVESIVCIPDIDSMVVLLQMDELNYYVIATGKLTQIIATAPSMVHNYVDEFVVTDNEDFEFQFTPIDGMELTMSDVEFVINNNGMKLTKGGESFKDAMSDYFGLVEQITVNTSVGTSTPPNNLAALTTAKNKILSFLQ